MQIRVDGIDSPEDISTHEGQSPGIIGSVMQRVLVVGPVPPPIGGVFSVMHNIAHSDISKDYVFEIFARSDVPSDAEGFFGRNLFRAKRMLRFFNQVRKGDYRFVHIHTADSDFLGSALFMLLARLAGTKTILHMHGTRWDTFYRNEPWFMRLFKRIGLALASKIVVLHQLRVDEIRKLLPNTDVRVLRNLVPAQAPPDPKEVDDVRQCLGFTKEDFVVLNIGWLGPNKGSYEIVRAVSKVVSEDDSVRFVLLGAEQPGNMARLKEIVEKEGLGRWVRIVGEVARDKVPAYYSLADIFLLASFSEGMPMTIIEAMQRGVPVISTSVGAVPGMVEHGVSGWLINPGSPEEIAESVVRLKRDGALRRKLAEAGKAVFEEKFEFSRGIGEIRSLYESM
jgi:glycosyltransferase involved in cell wall biosynthesis